VAGVFVAAAATKLLAIARFRDELADYELLPGPLIGLASVVLPLSELGAAGATFALSTRVAGSIALVVLLAVFSAAIGINLGQGHKKIRCACFGESSQTLSWVSLFRNGMLAVALLPAILLPAQTTQFLTFAGGIGALICGCLCWLLLEAARGVESIKNMEATQ
jgi:hypothetical protein